MNIFAHLFGRCHKLFYLLFCNIYVKYFFDNKIIIIIKYFHTIIVSIKKYFVKFTSLLRPSYSQNKINWSIKFLYYYVI